VYLNSVRIFSVFKMNNARSLRFSYSRNESSHLAFATAHSYDGFCVLCDRDLTLFDYFGCSHGYCTDCMYFLTSKPSAPNIYRVQCSECCFVLPRNCFSLKKGDNFSECPYCRNYMPTTCKYFSKNYKLMFDFRYCVPQI
jgi:hypothetical protein